MREDQFKKLEALQEKLCDAVLDEANPDTWPGKGKSSEEMTQDERGDRYWCKKNAAATFTLLNKTLSIQTYRKGGSSEDGQTKTPEEELDKEIKSHEVDALKKLEQFEKRKKIKVVK